MLGLRRVGDAARELAPTDRLTWRAVWEQSAAIQMVDAHSPDHRRAGVGIPALHATGEGSEDPAGTTGRGVAGTTAAADHGPRRPGRAAGLGHELVWVQAFGEAGLMGSRLRQPHPPQWRKLG